jgi:hypothetical protein
MATTKTPARSQRVARVKLEQAGRQKAISVRVPSDISSKDFARLGDEIIKIIKGQTGCTCLSGFIPVVFDTEFTDALEVNLQAGQ